jgi:hypothetical protein
MRHDDGHSSDELLARALLDAGDSASVALKVDNLPLAEALTVIFHGRRDLGTIQTYVTHGGLGAGTAVRADSLLRVPVDLDLGHAGDRDEAEELYASQARALRDSLVAADTVLSIWREPLAELSDGGVALDRSIEIQVRFPAYRLMPIALVAPDRQLTVAPVVGARTLADGRPPMGIACAQPDVARVYPLADDPEVCLADFLHAAAEHARELAARIDHQEQSIARFLELSTEDQPPH